MEELKSLPPLIQTLYKAGISKPGCFSNLPGAGGGGVKMQTPGPPPSPSVVMEIRPGICIVLQAHQVILIRNQPWKSLISKAPSSLSPPTAQQSSSPHFLWLAFPEIRTPSRLHSPTPFVSQDPPTSLSLHFIIIIIIFWLLVLSLLL